MGWGEAYCILPDRISRKWEGKEEEGERRTRVSGTGKKNAEDSDREVTGGGIRGGYEREV